MRERGEGENERMREEEREGQGREICSNCSREDKPKGTSRAAVKIQEIMQMFQRGSEQSTIKPFLPIYCVNQCGILSIPLSIK